MLSSPSASDGRRRIQRIASTATVAVVAVATTALLLPVSSSTAQAEPVDAPTPTAASGSSSKAKAESLDQLLSMVRDGYRGEREAINKREAEFKRSKEKQAMMLREAETELARLKQSSEVLEQRFQANETKLTELEETLRTRLGNMAELFGVVRQVAGDTRAQVSNSIISAEKPNRSAPIEKLAQTESLPSLPELEYLWYVLLEEMTESGKVVRFDAPVVSAAGEEHTQKVIRAGTFTAISQGKYLQWSPEVAKLTELGRQPAEAYLATVSSFEKQTGDELGALAIDPSRGAILALLVDTPDFDERVKQGGIVGYITMTLGALALLLGILRFLQLFITSVKIRGQLGAATPRLSNPLGRILSIHSTSPDMDVETLERKLDEAIIRESARLERALWLIKIVAVSAPLLGLLGTVTGMIRTFQAITLFGTGDPRLMAGGISEALVTTMIGLFVAIPLVLLHAGLSSMSKRMTGILEEQSAGIVAERAERFGAPESGAENALA